MKRQDQQRTSILWHSIAIIILLFSGASVSTLIFAEVYVASLEKKMNLKDMLQLDFGLELKIAGGFG
ncbi:MAG: hypothetical protein WC856_09420 [Methylococcaceae bacterium]|jgi:hypothetical protein